jgi:UDP-N-acetylmuramoyl-tripeptide--D-alanyl-D-alanine ligase
MKATLEDIAQALGAAGDYEGRGKEVVTGVQTDSRLVRPGDLFFCICGQRMDGHAFAREAVRGGAAAVVGEKPPFEDLDAPYLLVTDTVRALGRLARMWRDRFPGTVVAVTGSAGKTTVKELLASILSLAGETARNYKNWNNQVGLPLSVLSSSGREDYWVLEAGINYTGEMELLGSILAPDTVLVTNIGPVHLEGLGSVEGVAEEKARLLDHLRPGGLGMLSLDYPELQRAASRRRGVAIAGFSTVSEAEYSGRVSGREESGLHCFELSLRGETVRVGVPQPGEMMLENVLAAAAAAHALGVSADLVRQGLEQARLPEQRWSIQRQGGYVLIDDSYNANPLSMERALRCAAERSAGGPLLLLLGDMLELGDESEREHERLGGMGAEAGCSLLFYAGRYADQVLKGLKSAGAAASFRRVQDPEDFLQAWRELAPDRGTLLVKGSRGGRLERFLHRLIQELPE